MEQRSATSKDDDSEDRRYPRRDLHGRGAILRWNESRIDDYDAFGGGTTWAYTEPLTLTASASFFSSSDVGNAIFLYDADGNQLRCTIQAYTSGTVVTVLRIKLFPWHSGNVALFEWARAVDTILWSVASCGEDVSVLADAFVAANPNNST